MNGPPDRADYEPPKQVTKLPSWLSGQVAAIAAGLVGDALADEGLRRQHFIVLTALAERGAASQAALGRRLAIDRSDMHAVLGDLERQTLVARIRDGGDRRRKLVELTPSGARAQVRLEKKVMAAQEELLAPLSAAERRKLSRLLARLVEHHMDAKPA
jgi:MarR family transcriptional regulator, lower aerobic nicotinate degradation pathway regulator